MLRNIGSFVMTYLVDTSFVHLEPFSGHFDISWLARHEEEDTFIHFVKRSQVTVLNQNLAWYFQHEVVVVDWFVRRGATRASLVKSRLSLS